MKVDPKDKKILGVLRRFLRCNGTPEAEARMDERLGPVIQLGAKPQMKGGNYPLVYVIVNPHKDEIHDRLCVGAKDLKVARKFEEDHQDRIEACIHFEREAAEYGTAYIREGDKDHRSDVYRAFVGIDIKSNAIKVLPKDKYGIRSEGIEDVRGPSEVAGLSKSPKPKKTLKRDRTFKSVDDLRLALQRGEFIRR